MSTVSAGVGGQAVVAFQARGRGVALFLVAPGMEAVSLARSLGPEHPLFGIRVPNLEKLSGPHRLEDIAEMCAREIRKIRREGPYALAGWCAMGFLALEIARCLERDGSRVAFVAMFDARTVYLPSMNRGSRLIVKGCYLAQRLRFLLSRVLANGRAPLKLAVISRLKRVRQTRLSTRPSDDAAWAAAIRAHRPGPWAGRIVHIWAAERPRGSFRDPQFVCGFVSPGGFEFYEVPGSHVSMLAEPRISEVSRILALELDRADASRHEAALRRSPAFS
jgi:thioesterase domain-containing protein